LVTLVEADQILDKVSATTIIQKHLRYQPSELNGKIRLILRDLPVDELLDVFQAMIKSMNLGDGAFKAVVSSGPDLRAAIGSGFEKTSPTTNSWQDIDKRIVDARSVAARLGKRSTLVSGRVGKGVTEGAGLVRGASDRGLVDRNAAPCLGRCRPYREQAMDLVAEHFAGFRSDMSNRFSQVDKSLLSGSERIFSWGIRFPHW